MEDIDQCHADGSPRHKNAGVGSQSSLSLSLIDDRFSELVGVPRAFGVGHPVFRSATLRHDQYVMHVRVPRFQHCPANFATRRSRLAPPTGCAPFLNVVLCTTLTNEMFHFPNMGRRLRIFQPGSLPQSNWPTTQVRELLPRLAEYFFR
jgi:hypothetical protein